MTNCHYTTLHDWGNDVLPLYSTNSRVSFVPSTNSTLDAEILSSKLKPLILSTNIPNAEIFNPNILSLTNLDPNLKPVLNPMEKLYTKGGRNPRFNYALRSNIKPLANLFHHKFNKRKNAIGAPFESFMAFILILSYLIIYGFNKQSICVSNISTPLVSDLSAIFNVTPKTFDLQTPNVSEYDENKDLSRVSNLNIIQYTPEVHTSPLYEYSMNTPVSPICDKGEQDSIFLSTRFRSRGMGKGKARLS